MKGKKLGFCMCGSFCTHQKAMTLLRELAEKEWEIYPIFSPIVFETDTRFGRAADLIQAAEELCGRPVMHTIPQVEPIGPKGYLDILIVAPCTGNTLGKLACGITDTSVTMAVKAHLRNLKPVVLAVSTNDAISASAKNIGLLQNTKNVFFVPMAQDDPAGKECSLVADFGRGNAALESALSGRQLQPVLF